MRYDVLMKVSVYTSIEADSKEEAIEIANSGAFADLFPDDIMTDDIMSAEFNGKIFESED